MHQPSALEDACGDIIQKARQGLHLDVQALARQADITPQQLTAIEAYERIPSLEECRRLADTLHLDPDKLFAIAQDSCSPPLVPAIIGDFTVEDGVSTFSIENAFTRSGGLWGVGPYDVVPDETGEATTLADPITAGEHHLQRLTTISPPEAAVGIQDMTNGA